MVLTFYYEWALMFYCSLLLCSFNCCFSLFWSLMVVLSGGCLVVILRVVQNVVEKREGNCLENEF